MGDLPFQKRIVVDLTRIVFIWFFGVLRGERSLSLPLPEDHFHLKNSVKKDVEFKPFLTFFVLIIIVILLFFLIKLLCRNLLHEKSVGQLD